MSVGVFPLMQQLFIVYVREKYKIYSSLFSAFEYKLRGETWGDCIRWICNLVVLFQELNYHTALRTISRVNLGYFLSETVLNTNLSVDWNFTHRVGTLSRRQLRM